MAPGRQAEEVGGCEGGEVLAAAAGGAARVVAPAPGPAQPHRHQGGGAGAQPRALAQQGGRAARAGGHPAPHVPGRHAARVPALGHGLALPGVGAGRGRGRTRGSQAHFAAAGAEGWTSSNYAMKFPAMAKLFSLNFGF